VERFRGRKDLELDEEGRKQAQATALRAKEWPVAAVYSSPLLRTRETAESLAKQVGLEVQELPGIIDIDYGNWQGLSPEEVAAQQGDLYQKWLHSPHQVSFPDGESLIGSQDRAMAAVDDLVEKHKKETIALVSHKVVCQVMVLSLLGLELSHFWQITQDVCAINYFEFRGAVPSALLINDTCHLRGLG
jgi:broad specificity phosphatase PhoE